MEGAAVAAIGVSIFSDIVRVKDPDSGTFFNNASRRLLHIDETKSYYIQIL